MRRKIAAARVAAPRLLTVAAVLATLLAGGCGLSATPEAPAGGASSPTPRSAAAVLVASVPHGEEVALHFTVKDADSTVEGAVDAAAKAMTMSVRYKDPDLGFTMTMGFLVIDQRSWIKVTFSGTEGLTGLPRLPKKWLLLDPEKISDPDSLPLTFDGPDPASVAVLFGSVVTASQIGPGEYEGTLDLTQATDADLADADAIAAMGDAATAVPFAATLDANGRLASLRIRIPAAGKTPAYEHRITYGDYGEAPNLVAPSEAASLDAPAEAYELLNA